MLKEFWIFKDEPNSNINVFMAESKRQALELFNKEMGEKFKFTSELAPKNSYSLVSKKDWLNYNFAKVSTITSI